MVRTHAPALLAVVVAGGLGCSRDVPHLELTREEPSQQTVGGVHFVELFERDANETSPLLVGLHGRGDTAEGFARAWHNFPVKLEIALALAPCPTRAAGNGSTGRRGRPTMRSPRASAPPRPRYGPPSPSSRTAAR